jgi:hypothetical protein
MDQMKIGHSYPLTAESHAALPQQRNSGKGDNTMPMRFTDNRPAAHQGDLPLATLEAIMRNSIFNASLPFGGWNAENASVSITNGAHQGTFYPGAGDYYFDISVNGGGVLHCLIANPSGENNEVLAIR